MSKEKEKEKRRRSFSYFISKTYPDFCHDNCYTEIFEVLQNFHNDIRKGNNPRLILNMPPRTGKSTLTAIRFALFCLLNNPTWEIACASYAVTLASKHSMIARELLITNPFIKLAFPHIKLSSKSSSVSNWNVDCNGVMSGGYKAIGVGGGITGFGANLLIIDDSVKNIQEADNVTLQEKLWDWYTTAARTRLAPCNGVINIQTRWNLNDLTGKIIEHEKRKWQVLQFPAINEEGDSNFPSRFSTEVLQDTRDTIPQRYWLSLYQQNPIVREGNIIKENQLIFKTINLGVTPSRLWLQSWDLRFGKSREASSSYVVGQVWCKIENDFYLVEQVREKLSYYETKQAFISMCDKYPNAAIKIVEKKANGEALEDDLESHGITLVNPKGDKIQRLEYCYGLFVTGRVIINSTLEPAIKQELLQFPRSPNDDMVDALSQALSYYIDLEQSLVFTRL